MRRSERKAERREEALARQKESVKRDLAALYKAGKLGIKEQVKHGFEPNLQRDIADGKIHGPWDWPDSKLGRWLRNFKPKTKKKKKKSSKKEVADGKSKK